MAVIKTKIVLDADVIILFAKGGLLSLLPRIFPEYEYIVLDIVYKEVKQHILNQLNNQIKFFKNIREVTFGLTDVMGLGRGESACMVFCRYNHDVIGSSNLRDIVAYCEKHEIVYLTTIDFLFYGIQRKVITKDQANEFITTVNSMGSRVPQVDFDTYICSKI